VQPVQRPTYALALRLACSAVLAGLLALVKYAGENGISLPEIMFWRQAITAPLLFGWLWWTGGLDRLRTRRIGAHAARAAVGMTNMVFNFSATILLPLAVSTTLGFTTPLFAVVLAALVLGERVGRWRWTAVALGFVGVIVIAQPSGGAIHSLGAVLGLIAGFITAIINLQIRDLGRSEESICTVFWFGLFGSLLAGSAYPFFASAHTLREWAMLFALGWLGMVMQLLLTASLRYGAVASIVVMDYSSLVWATFYGWAIWGKLPPAVTWLGAPLIIAAGLTIAWREHRLARNPSPLTAHELD
jgi:drug/metabolite transporter (DMT)-like permease